MENPTMLVYKIDDSGNAKIVGELQIMNTEMRRQEVIEMFEKIEQVIIADEEQEYQVVIEYLPPKTI